MFSGTMTLSSSEKCPFSPGISVWAGVVAFAGLSLCSCQSSRNLADFGKIQVSDFGDPAKPGPAASQAFSSVSRPAPTTLAAQGTNQQPGISANDPVVQMARARAADSSVPAPTTIAYRPPAAAVQPTPATTNTKRVSAATVAAYRDAIPKEFVVKTTAYTHTEADSLQYGTKNAAGDDLKFGYVRSAAADWSRYPVGTKFKIKGLPYQYVVDDYGSALVGTDTIDLYKPSHATMDQWGARNVGIEVLEWGSFEESRRILESRKHKPGADHVRQMLNNIEQKIRLLPPVLRDGFRA